MKHFALAFVLIVFIELIVGNSSLVKFQVTGMEGFNFLGGCYGNWTLVWEFKADYIIKSVSISSDGSYIAAVGDNWESDVGRNDVLYLLTGNGELVWKKDSRALFGYANWIHDVSVSQNASYIAVGSEGATYLTQKDGNIIWKKEFEGMNFVSISDDGNYIAVGTYPIGVGWVHFLNKNGQELWNFSTVGSIVSISISKSGGYVAVGDYKGYAYLFNNQGKLLWDKKLGEECDVYVSTSANGEIIGVGTSYGEIALLDRNGDWILNLTEVQHSIEGTSISSIGNFLLVASGSEGLRIYNASGELFCSFMAREKVLDVDNTPQGNRVVIGSDDLRIYLLENPILNAVNFLQKLYNPSVGLCRETIVGELQNITSANGTTYAQYTNQTYWIASDNYLASLALKPYNRTLSELINQTINMYYQGPYIPYQILEGKSIPLTLHVPNTYVFENTTNYIIALTLYNGTPDCNTYLDFASYGDTLVYQALNYYVLGYPYEWCVKLYMKAYEMFDGKGVADKHFKETAYYDNMKLALLIFGAKVLNINADLTDIQQRLWNAQKTSGNEAGGITSIADSSGMPIGSANCETTALTLIAYNDEIIEHARSKRPGETKQLIEIMFPYSSFNETSNILTNLTAIPLLDNFTVKINNQIEWIQNSEPFNPRIVIGLFSSLSSPKNLSIQIVEYYNHHLDVVIHNETHPDGYKIIDGYWLNPLTASLISNTLYISSPAGTYIANFSRFQLAYITAGSTEPYECEGGNVTVIATHDKTSPSTSISLVGIIGENNWFVSNVSVSFIADDAISGVDSILYSFDNVTWEKYVKPFIIGNEGRTTIYFKSLDRAGNIEPTRTETIKIDKTPPTGSITINNDSPYTNSTSVLLSITGSDEASGVSKIRLSNDGIWDTEPWEDYTPNKAWMLSGVDGAKTVYVQFMDNAGLISATYSDTIILDTTKPLIVEVEQQPENDIQPNQPVKIIINVVDSLSGIRNVILSYNINNTSIWTNTTMTLNVSTGLYEASIQGQQAGTLVKYKLIAYDNAGNLIVEDYTYTVIPEFPSTALLAISVILSTIIIVLASRKSILNWS